MPYSVCPFSGKTDNFDFFRSKIDVGLEIQKTNVNKIHHPRDTICANFQKKQKTFTLLAQICPKMNLELEIQKTNVGIRITILEVHCVCQFLDKMDNFDFFSSNFPKNEFRVRNSEN